MKFYIVRHNPLSISAIYDADKSNEDGFAAEDRPPYATHVALGELDPDCVRAVSWQETEVIEIEPARTIPADGYYETVTEQTIPAVTETRVHTRYGLEEDPALVDAKKERLRLEKVAKAREKMEADIRVELERVYGVSTLAEATSKQLVWKEMRETPLDFVDPELGFASEKDVVDFVKDKLAAAKASTKWQLRRQAQFEAERAKILGKPK